MLKWDLNNRGKDMGKCSHFEEYIKVEVEAIGRRIEEVRQEMSLKTGYDVGHEAAQTAYMNSFLNGNAKEFRAKWCKDCPDKACEETDNEEDS